MLLPLPEPILEGTTREYSVDNLLQQGRDPDDQALMDTGDRRLLGFNLPPWQRDHVWTRRQQVAFIEGIFLGLGCGYYVMHEFEWDRAGNLLPMSGWLLDGQQRITAIRDFVQDRFEIFGGRRYSSLDKVEQVRRFRRQAFPCIELAYQPDEDRLKEVYRRLNFGGTAHTAEDLARLEGQG